MGEAGTVAMQVAKAVQYSPESKHAPEVVFAFSNIFGQSAVVRMVFQVFPRIWIRVGLSRVFRSNIRTRRVKDDNALIFMDVLQVVRLWPQPVSPPGRPFGPSQTAIFAGQRRVASVGGKDIMWGSGMAATGETNDRTG